MREIKFRAWDNLENRIHGNVQTGIYQDPDEIVEFGKILDFACYEVMQYTGLKDKNNKEIYEGDIAAAFNFDDRFFRHEVVCENGAFGYRSQFTNDFIPYASNVSFDWVNGKSNRIVIIGNIYENPELMEE